MEEVNKYFQMEMFMKVILIMVKDMVKVNFKEKMVNLIKGIF